MTYEEARDFLFALPRFGDVGAAAYKPGLERMEALLAAMGNPHDRFESIHIAGTNGKGSTASMVAAIGTASGKRIGLHTSPHLFDFAERLRIDGIPASHEWIASAVQRFQADILGISPSFFEASGALSFLYFAEEDVDLAVVEVGMGGRLDATNVLTPRASAVTHIGLDHTKELGDTLGDIAREKGGIAKLGVPMLSSVEDTEALKALGATAELVGAPFENIRETTTVEIVGRGPGSVVLDISTPDCSYDELTIGLPGDHQAWNAALAVRLSEIVWPGIEKSAVHDGLINVVGLSGLRGRFETIRNNPRIVADVAHNLDGWRAALACAQPNGQGQLYVLIGVMADKDIAGLGTLLSDFDATALPVGFDSQRALSKTSLAHQFQSQGLRTINVDGIEEGIGWFVRNAVDGDVLLVTGSHLAVAALPDLSLGVK